jgi:hypothetical protein
MSSGHSSLITDLAPTSTDVEVDYESVLSMSRSSRQDPAHSESNHNTSYALGPFQEKQHVSSARKTLSLQGRGLKQIRAYLNNHRHASNSSNRGPTKSTGEPHVYGLDYHYQFTNMWGATTCARVHRLNGTLTFGPGDPASTLDVLDTNDVLPVLMSTLFQRPVSRKTSVIASVPSVPFDLSQFSFEKRLCDKLIWAEAKSKRVGIKNFAPVFLTTPPLVICLRDDGILPLVSFPNSKGDSLKIPFGPYLVDDSKNPIPAGTCLSSSAVYRRYGMTLHSSQNEAWRSQPDTVAAIIVRSPENNCLLVPLGLPMSCFPDNMDHGDYPEFLDLISSTLCHDLNVLQPRSALTEMKSILPTGLHYGYNIYRSGGNSSVDGAAPPGLADYTPGVGAWLESGQTISNSYNFSLEVVAERSTIIEVYGSDDTVPSEYRDNRLRMSLGSHAEQAFYFGCYREFARGERPALTVAQIDDIYKTYLPVYPRLRFDNLWFLLCSHRMYRLIPVDYPCRHDGYRYLKLDSRDSRQIEMIIPHKMSFSRAMGEPNE